MAARLLLPLHDAPRLTSAELELARDVVAEGAGALRLAMAPRMREPMGEGARFLYRRWVLEVLLLLRARGPMTYNEISRALGRLAGESLAPKLQDLERERLVERAPSGSPPRVRYQLTPEGAPVASGAFALTAVKREHIRALTDARQPRVIPEALQRPPSPDALGSYRRAVEDLAAAHLARAAAPVEDQLRAARRLSEACVRKWHGEVLSTLAAAGPLRYSELRDALDIGDQALANALSDLARLESVRREGAAWGITPLGLVDVCVGGALVLLLPRVRRSIPPDRLHAV